MAKKTNANNAPSECIKLDQLFSGGDDFVEQGFVLFDTLISNAKIREYYKNNITINEHGVVTEPSSFSENTRVQLLLRLVPLDETLAREVHTLDISNCSQKLEIASKLFSIEDLVDVRCQITWQDRNNLDLDALLSHFERIPNLKRLSLRNWTSLTSLPVWMDGLEKISAPNAKNIKLPSRTIFSTLPLCKQLMFIERCKHDWNVKDKERFDDLVNAEALLKIFDSLSVSVDAEIIINDGFFKRFNLSTDALYNIHKIKPQQYQKVRSAKIKSSSLPLLSALPNITTLTLDVIDTDTHKTIDLQANDKLLHVVLNNVPKELHIVSPLKKFEIYGSCKDFSSITIGEKRVTDFYEAMSLNNGQYGYNRWYYGNLTFPDICYLPALTNHSVQFISDDLRDKMWREQETVFWESYLSLSPSAAQKVLSDFKKLKHDTSTWVNLEEYDFLWNFLAQQGVSLPFISLRGKAARQIQSGTKGVRIYIRDAAPLDLSHVAIEQLKIKGKRCALRLTLPKGLIHLNIENTSIFELDWSSCAQELTSLTLVSIRPEYIPDLTQFPNLKTLKLINCGLTSLPTIPTSLTHLNISGNPLSSFPLDIIECVELETLEMASCDFTTVHSGIANLGKLSKVSMTNTSIQNLDFLTELPMLKTLKIGFSLERKPWHSWHRNLTDWPLEAKVPMLPAGLTLNKLIVHDALAITPGAYQHATLSHLDIQRAGDGTAVHIIKQFKHIEQMRGFLPNDFQPTQAPGVPTPVEEAYAPHSLTGTHPRYTLGYFTELEPKFKKGLELYNKMLKS